MPSRFRLEPDRPVDVYLTSHGKGGLYLPPGRYHEEAMLGVMLTNPVDLYPTDGNIYGPRVLHGEIEQPIKYTEDDPDQPPVKAMVKLGRISAEKAEPFRREFLDFTNRGQWNTVAGFIKAVWKWLWKQEILSRQQYKYGWLMMDSCELNPDAEDRFDEVVEQCDGVIFFAMSTQIWKDGVKTDLFH